MDARSKMLAKVRKLFAKANDVAGTPEADAFNAKAYDLIAQYGIDEAAARADEHTGPAPIVKVDYVLYGKYVTDQRRLLAALAKALHCEHIELPAKLTGNFEDVDLVIGADVHTDRVGVLFAMLMPQMVAGAAKQRPTGSASVVVYRRSWMRGFRQEVALRLGAAETAATKASTGTDVVLLDDAARAADGLQDHARSLGLRVKMTTSRVRNNAEALERGRAAGARVDVGQARMGGRRALTA